MAKPKADSNSKTDNKQQLAFKKIKLQIPAGQANPAPPIGPALGQAGVNIMEFCKAFNAQTQGVEAGLILPVIITVNTKDRSFSFEIKQPPASVLLKKITGIKSGSAKPNQSKIGKITRAQLRSVAEKKLPDLNTNNLDMAERIIAGTAKSMGFIISEE